MRRYEITVEQLNKLILESFPYPIAVNYRRLLEAEGWEARTRKCIEVFEYGVRAITLGVLSQYLIRDVHQVSDPILDRKLHRKLAEATLGQWTEFLFLSLHAYRSKRKLFFMPELYDLYWDTSQEPHQPRKGLRTPFDRLVQIRNDLAHRLAPESEEAWESLGREALGHLQTILAQFSFLQHYDLVRVVGRRKDEYEYERYTGQEITTHCKRLRGRGELRTGWFYLSRQDRSVLGLHPLLIFWTNGGEPELAGEERRDAAVYERLLKETVEYVATVVRRMVKEHDADLLAQFRQLIYYNIEHVKMARKRTVLSWSALRQAAEELTAKQMGTVWEKYRRELYLQREETFRKFQAFLASDKGCFVLTGKSGVGKSNFVLSLADEYAGREDVCLLMYNGARLSIPETMVQTISQDLARYLTLEGEATKDLFAELEQQGEMARKTLIAVFDAINENANGKALLRRIDQMVGEARYPWLKVMITSRPQAWRTLKRRLRLAEERYYRERGSDEYWVELQEFTVQLEPFRREELPEVYEKYRQAYGLQTEYEAMKAPIRSALRDPLMLRLVAEIYRGQAIPEHIRVVDIYNQYVQALLATERLYEEDIILLEQELMPLMIAYGDYGNELTASQLHVAKTSDGRPLWELIRSDDLLSSGRRVNQSFTNLVDAEILTLQGSPLDYQITLKYERFYDYFAGKRLYEIVSVQEDRHRLYVELIESIGNYPYLWGAIESALIAELKAGQRDLIIEVGQQELQSIRKMVLSVLVLYGRSCAQEGASLLERLYADRQLRVNKIAVQVAGTLGVEPVLVEAGQSPEPDIRAAAARATYYLWQEAPEAGWRVLKKWASSVRGKWGLPRLRCVESCLGLSILILTDRRNVNYQDRRILQPLQQILRGVLEDLLFVKKGETERPGFRSLARNIILSSVIKFGLTIVEGRATVIPRPYPSPIPDVAAFFRLPQSKKDIFQRLLEHLKANTPIREIENELFQAVEDDDALTIGLVQIILLLDSPLTDDQGLALVKQLFDTALESRRPGLAVSQSIFNASLILRRRDKPISDQAFQLYQQMQEDYLTKAKGIYYTTTTNAPRWCAYIDAFTELEWKKYHRTEPGLLSRSFEEAVRENDKDLIRNLIHELGTLASIAGLGQIALNGSRVLLHHDDPDVKEWYIRLLSWIRLYDQNAVEDFLEEHDALHDLKRLVRTQEVHEDMFGDILVSRVGDLTAKLLFVPRIREEAIWILEKALECKNLEQWLKLTLKRLINFMYGEPLFQLEQA